MIQITNTYIHKLKTFLLKIKITIKKVQSEINY